MNGWADTAATPLWPIYLGLLIGLYASEDLTLIGAGLLIHSGQLDFVPTLAFLLTAVVVADTAYWWIGRQLQNGSDRMHAPLGRWMQSRCEPWRRTFERRGLSAVIAARFIPGARLPVYLAAGLSRMPMRRFVPAVLAAALLWVPLVLGLSQHVAGPALDSVGGLLSGPGPWLLTLVLTTGLIALAFRKHNGHPHGDAPP